MIMITMAIITIAIIILVAIIAFYVYHFKKPKSYLEKMKEADKILKKRQKTLGKSGKELETFKNDLIKKNDEMLKEMLKNQG